VFAEPDTASDVVARGTKAVAAVPSIEDSNENALVSGVMIGLLTVGIAFLTSRSSHRALADAPVVRPGMFGFGVRSGSEIA